MKTPITILLVDDHTIVREGLRALLETSDDFTVIGEAANGLQAVEMAQDLKPDVVVLDLAMPQLNGIEAARRIRQQQGAGGPKMLILSAHGDDAYLEEVASIGVQGYLVKQASAHLLASAIRQVHIGETIYSPAIAKRLTDANPEMPATALHGRRSGRAKKPSLALTTREREVLQLVAESYANKQIASELSISIKTVEKHRQSVMGKLGIHDAAGLTRYAISAGIIESVVQSTI